MEAVIFVGVQATGKSTFYQQRFFRTHVRISLDMLRTRHREDVILQACLDAKQRFVVDNTNPTRQERGKYIQAAKQAGFRVIGYYFQSKIDEALARNSVRPSKERVPEVGVRGAYARLELPAQTEGFDELYYVRIGDEGAFTVEVWQP